MERNPPGPLVAWRTHSTSDCIKWHRRNEAQRSRAGACWQRSRLRPLRPHGAIRNGDRPFHDHDGARIIMRASVAGRSGSRCQPRRSSRTIKAEPVASRAGDRKHRSSRKWPTVEKRQKATGVKPRPVSKPRSGCQRHQTGRDWWKWRSGGSNWLKRPRARMNRNSRLPAAAIAGRATSNAEGYVRPITTVRLRPSGTQWMCRRSWQPCPRRRQATPQAPDPSLEDGLSALQRCHALSGPDRPVRFSLCRPCWHSDVPQLQFCGWSQTTFHSHCSAELFSAHRERTSTIHWCMPMSPWHMPVVRPASFLFAPMSARDDPTVQVSGFRDKSITAARQAARCAPL